MVRSESERVRSKNVKLAADWQRFLDLVKA